MQRAFGIENIPVDGMPVPPFCCGELREVVGNECLLLLYV
jgi:hypothetical protein